jgi:hypothetical protein
MQSAPILWETNVLYGMILFTIYSMHTSRCLTGPMLYAISQFLIPKVVTQPRARPRARKVTYPSPTPRFAAPDSEDELLVVALAAATAGYFVLNVVTACEDSRPGNPGRSAKGKARIRNRGREAARSVCAPRKSSPHLDYFAGRTLMANRRCPAKDEFLKLAGFPGTISQCARKIAKRIGSHSSLGLRTP